MEDERADEIRRRYLYRRLLLRGRIRLPVRAARALLGPDCAYHLYRHQSCKTDSSQD